MPLRQPLHPAQYLQAVPRRCRRRHLLQAHLPEVHLPAHRAALLLPLLPHLRHLKHPPPNPPPLARPPQNKPIGAKDPIHVL